MQRKQAIKLYIFTDTHSQNNVKKKTKQKTLQYIEKARKVKYQNFEGSCL